MTSDPRSRMQPQPHPAPQPLADGVWRLPVPLHGHSVGHVNVYAFVADEGVLLVDTGWNGALEALTALLDGIGVGLGDVRRVLLTHFHMDHCGLVGAVQRRGGAAAALHADDAALLDARYFRRAPFEADTLAWARDVGLPEEGVAFAVEQIARFADRVQPFAPDERLVDGQLLRFGRWEFSVLHTPGHTAGHCCFFEATTGFLLTGDHVFPGISSSPTYRPQSSPDPVGSYLTSLDRLERLDVSLVLPGHQPPFPGLAGRLEELRNYHRRRLRRVHGALAAPATLYEVCAGLSRRPWDERPWQTRLIVLGEAYAHVRFLASSGAVGCEDGPPLRWRALGRLPAGPDGQTADVASPRAVMEDREDTVASVDQRHERIEAALDELRPGLDADGFELSLESIDDEAANVALTATPEACMDCLVPDEMMVTMLEGAIASREPSVSKVVLKKYNM